MTADKIDTMGNSDRYGPNCNYSMEYSFLSLCKEHLWTTEIWTEVGFTLVMQNSHTAVSHGKILKEC